MLVLQGLPTGTENEDELQAFVLAQLRTIEVDLNEAYHGKYHNLQLECSADDPSQKVTMKVCSQELHSNYMCV